MSSETTPPELPIKAFDDASHEAALGWIGELNGMPLEDHIPYKLTFEDILNEVVTHYPEAQDVIRQLKYKLAETVEWYRAASLAGEQGADDETGQDDAGQPAEELITEASLIKKRKLRTRSIDELVRIARKIGLVVEPGGKHQNVIYNPRNGRRVPVSTHDHGAGTPVQRMVARQLDMPDLFER